MTNRGRQLFCRRCEGHGKKNTLRGHGAICQYIDCNCRSCSRLMKMRKSAFLRRYKDIVDSDSRSSTSTMAEQLVSEYKLIDGTNPRLRFANKNKDIMDTDIANPTPLKICDFKEELMEKFNLPPSTQNPQVQQQPNHINSSTSQASNVVFLPFLNNDRPRVSSHPSTTAHNGATLPQLSNGSSLPQMSLGNFINASSLPNLMNFNQNGQHSLPTNLMNLQLQKALVPRVNNSAFMSLPNLPSTNMSNLTAFANLPGVSTSQTVPLTSASNLPNFPTFQQPNILTFPQYNMASFPQPLNTPSSLSEPKPFLMQIPNNYQQSLAYLQLLNSTRMNRS